MIQYLKLFFNIYKSRKTHSDFLKRKASNGNRYKVIKRTLKGSFMQEKRQAFSVSKQDYAAYLLIEAIEENNPAQLKKELFQIILLLTTWYLSLNPEGETIGSEEQNSMD